MREARCSCGQLRLTIDGDPIRVSVCHCLACQRRTGSPFGEQARFPADRVRATGRSRQYVRYSEEDAEPRVYRFCPECGATVYYSIDPGQVAVPVGALADPSFPAPRRSVWETHRHPWVALPEDAERYD